MRPIWIATRAVLTGHICHLKYATIMKMYSPADTYISGVPANVMLTQYVIIFAWIIIPRPCVHQLMNSLTRSRLAHKIYLTASPQYTNHWSPQNYYTETITYMYCVVISILQALSHQFITFCATMTTKSHGRSFSQNLGASRFVFKIVWSLRNLTGATAARLSGRHWNTILPISFEASRVL